MSEQNVWNERPEFQGDTLEYIKARVLMLAAVFNRKASDELVEVFREVLRGYPFSALKGAFSKAESTLERFPTPKIMRELCNEEMPSNSWRYNFRPSTDPNGIACLIDPDPSCDFCREPLSMHPNKRCAAIINLLPAKFMYRPQDCEEGREFLVKLEQFKKKTRKLFREPGMEG